MFQQIDDDNLSVLVHTFYDRVRQDPMLGPIFEVRIGASWQKHMNRMVDFWSSVLLGSGRFKGNPMLKHALIPDLSSAHFDHWMEMFSATVQELYDEDVAAVILAKARNMRRGLERYAVAQPTLPIVG